MFFILSKILAFVLTPIIWVFVLVLWSLFSKNPIRKRKLLISAAVVLFIFSNSFLYNVCMRAWEEPAVAQSSLKKYDVGIVLGGMAWYDFQLNRIQFVSSADRIFQAVDLYKKGIIKKIFISGGSGSVRHPEMIEAKFIKDYFVGIGLPEEDILIEYKSQNTRENAIYSKSKLDSLQFSGNYLLISSAFHLPRAKRCFEKVGLICDVYATDRYSGAPSYDIETFIIPEAKTLASWNWLLHEWFGYVTYKMMGYI